MDLGLGGRCALVLGSTSGLGAAMPMAAMPPAGRARPRRSRSASRSISESCSISGHWSMKSAGVPVRFNTVKSGGHGAGFGGAELEKMRRDFFDRHLKGVENDAARWPPAARASTEAVSTAAK